eukprot:821013-Rhodomonas_salina.1
MYLSPGMFGGMALGIVERWRAMHSASTATNASAPSPPVTPPTIFFHDSDLRVELASSCFICPSALSSEAGPEEMKAPGRTTLHVQAEEHPGQAPSGRHWAYPSSCS